MRKAKFIALPVKEGDAFFATIDDKFRVLVDGGKYRKQLPKLFLDHGGKKGVDVLVCTHNDADHAEGVIGFLESCLPCKELWLPGFWYLAIAHLPENPEEIIVSLLRRVEEARSSAYGEELNISYAQEEAWWYKALFPEFFRDSYKYEGIEAEAWALSSEEVRSAHRVDDIESVFYKYANLFAFYPYFARLFAEIPKGHGPFQKRYQTSASPTLLAKAAKRALGDVKRLVELARLAYCSKIPVRYFKYNPAGAAKYWSKQNRCWTFPLWPLNATLVHTQRQLLQDNVIEKFWYFLYLTTANQKSLVLWLDVDDGQSGVLFTADSDLKGVYLDKIPQYNIATAPHHGSCDNREVYKRIQKPMIWVRSDKKNKRRPCLDFLQAPGQRFCTTCRGSTRPTQAVQLCLVNGSWHSFNTQACSCSLL